MNIPTRVSPALSHPPPSRAVSPNTLPARPDLCGCRIFGYFDRLPCAPAQDNASCLERPPSERPYTRVSLIDPVENWNILQAEYLIRTCGAGVALNSELESDLRKAGAENNVVAAVRDVAPKPMGDGRPAPPPAPCGPANGSASVNSRDGLRYIFIPPGGFRMVQNI